MTTDTTVDVDAIKTALMFQFNTAADDFRTTPSALNYATMARAMLAHQQAWQVFRRTSGGSFCWDVQARRALALCQADDNPANWGDIIVKTATGKDIRTLLRESVT